MAFHQLQVIAEAESDGMDMKCLGWHRQEKSPMLPKEQGMASAITCNTDKAARNARARLL